MPVAIHMLVSKIFSVQISTIHYKVILILMNCLAAMARTASTVTMAMTGCSGRAKATHSLAVTAMMFLRQATPAIRSMVGPAMTS
jgi:hypothetical protein